MYYRIAIFLLLAPWMGLAQNRFVSGSLPEAASLQVFITDGFDKISRITPVIFLYDTTEGKTVAHFTRILDAAGDPMPQIVPAGKYTMTIGLQASQKIGQVTVAAGRMNRVTAKLDNGSLRFRYMDSTDNLIDRPVSEYEAQISSLENPGPALLQRCDAGQDYGPGRYRITINSHPPMIFDDEIEIGGGATEIMLPEPGIVAFSGAPGKFEVTAIIKDAVIPCPDFFLVSNTWGRPLSWRPGAYELRRTGVSNKPAAINRFRIYSGKTVAVILK